MGINLVRREYNKKNAVVFVAGLVLIACVCAVICKLGVIDQFERLSNAEAEYNKVHESNVLLAEKIAKYAEVQIEYRTYSTDWMLDSFVDRKDVLDMVEAELLPCGNVRNIRIYENTALITISGMTLDEVSDMVVSIKEQPIVSAVTVDTANTTGQTGSEVICTLTISLKLPKDEQSDE